MGAKLTIIFYSSCKHHAFAIQPIYNKMVSQGKDVIAISNQDFKKASGYKQIVSSTAIEAFPKRNNTIFHFHSLSPYHTNPGEQDYKYIPYFKAVIFPGMWWVNKWKKLPELWRVVGWPKTDSLINLKKLDSKTVLYASSMFDFYRMKTLRLLLHLSHKLKFKLIVKPHHGTAMWFKKELNALVSEAEKEATVIQSDIDVVSLFGIADILVSEASGALWEFLATGKPSIQMQQGERWGRVFPGGILKANFENLENIVQGCFDNPDITKSSGWCEKVMSKIDGKATKRAIQFIEEVFNV